MRKVKTIKLKGKDYVQVAERVRTIHEERKDAFDIVTTYEVTSSGNIVFTATLIIETKGGKQRTFTGHSFGKLGGEKAFEKLETVAVGRALAFAGYHGDGDIASAEEMENIEPEIDYDMIEQAQIAIADAKTIEELKSVFQKLKKDVRNHKSVIEAKDARKKELSV